MADARRFVVSRIDWAEPGYGDAYSRRTARTFPVAAFDTFDGADADRAAREAAAREGANPFRCGGEALFYQSSLDAARLHDWLMDAGIEPPESPKAHVAWAAWWDAFAPKWTDEQRAHAWAALDKVRFFEVSEERPDRKAYVIVELNWQWEDEPTLQADYEGGNTVRAFRSRERAEAECERLNRERQAQADHLGYQWFTRSTRIDSGDTTEIAETAFFEVAEVELGDDA